MNQDRRRSNGGYSSRPFSLENNESSVYGDFIRRSFPNVPFPLLKPCGGIPPEQSRTGRFQPEMGEPVLYVVMVNR